MVLHQRAKPDVPAGNWAPDCPAAVAAPGATPCHLQSHPSTESALPIRIKCHRRRRGPGGIFTNTSPTCSMVDRVLQSLLQLSRSQENQQSGRTPLTPRRGLRVADCYRHCEWRLWRGSQASTRSGFQLKSNKRLRAASSGGTNDYSPVNG